MELRLSCQWPNGSHFLDWLFWFLGYLLVFQAQGTEAGQGLAAPADGGVVIFRVLKKSRESAVCSRICYFPLWYCCHPWNLKFGRVRVTNSGVSIHIIEQPIIIREAHVLVLFTEIDKHPSLFSFFFLQLGVEWKGTYFLMFGLAKCMREMHTSRQSLSYYLMSCNRWKLWQEKKIQDTQYSCCLF